MCVINIISKGKGKNEYICIYTCIYIHFLLLSLPAAGAKGQHTFIRGQKPQNAN